MAKLYK